MAYIATLSNIESALKKIWSDPMLNAGVIGDVSNVPGSTRFSSNGTPFEAFRAESPLRKVSERHSWRPVLDKRLPPMEEDSELNRPG